MKNIFVIIFMSANLISQAQQTRLIVRADDMGISHATNLACRDVFTKGIAKSVEIIAPSPWFLEAVKFLQANPTCDAGIHLAITSEWSNLKWRPITCSPSLTDSNGYFFPTIWKGSADLPSLNNHQPDSAEVEKELRAQIEMAKKHLPNLSHISIHMGFDDSNPIFKKIVLKLSAEYHLPITQKPDIEEFPSSGIKTNDKTKREDLFIAQLQKLKKGKTYLFVAHPCYNTNEMESIVSGSYINVGADREADAAVLQSKKVKQALKKMNIEIISVKEFFH